MATAECLAEGNGLHRNHQIQVGPRGQAPEQPIAHGAAHQGRACGEIGNRQGPGVRGQHQPQAVGG